MRNRSLFYILLFSFLLSGGCLQARRELDGSVGPQVLSVPLSPSPSPSPSLGSISWIAVDDQGVIYGLDSNLQSLGQKGHLPAEVGSEVFWSNYAYNPALLRFSAHQGMQKIIFNGSDYLLFSTNIGTSIYKTTDLMNWENWNQGISGWNTQFENLYWDGGRWYANVLDSIWNWIFGKTLIYRSPDALTWSIATGGIAPESSYSILRVNSKWILSQNAIGYSGYSSICTSSDGLSFSSNSDLSSSYNIYSLATDGARVVGSNVAATYGFIPGSAPILVSDDFGLTWATGGSLPSGSTYVNNVLYDGSRYLFSVNASPYLAFSTDGGVSLSTSGVSGLEHEMRWGSFYYFENHYVGYDGQLKYSNGDLSFRSLEHPQASSGRFFIGVYPKTQLIHSN